VGDFLREGYRFQISDAQGKLFALPRLKKAIAGFSASVARSLLWLRREKLLADEHLTTEAIVADYWPPQHLETLYNASWVQQQIKAGQRIAEDERTWLASKNIEVATLNWGPFGGSESSDKFLFSYAKDAIKEFDPFANVTRSSPFLSEIADPQRWERNKDLTIASGVCETLPRKFRGLHFVSCPLVAFPILCLLVTKKSNKRAALSWSFVDLVAGKIEKKDVRLAAIPNDLGHTLLSSLLEDREIDEEIHIETPENIADALLSLAQHDSLAQDNSGQPRPIALFADGIAILDTFNRLSPNEDLQLDIVVQNNGREDFCFFLGLILLQEDKELVPLLEEAQRHVIIHEWRAQRHFANLLDDVERWYEQFGPPAWPGADSNGRTKPIILVPTGRIKDYVLAATQDETRALAVVKAMRDLFNERAKAKGKRYLRNLIRFTGEIST
jgi:hypothetical protein